MDPPTILCFYILTNLYCNTSLHELCGEYVRFGIELGTLTMTVFYHF